MFNKIFTTLTLLLIMVSVAMGQTGKITGKVVDQQTDEALVGANILVIGTSYGAATDINGSFTISQVPSGTYSIRASYVGYQGVTISNIRVTSGLTQEVDFRLPSESIATEEVRIVAQRPLIEKSATNAVRIISADDISSLPTRNLNDIVALQPGVVRQNNMTFIRGSRADETGYILEGADVKNVLSRNGGQLVTVSPDALSEILVQAGGYTAEYGNANAGIIQQDFKTGTDQFHFSFRAETDNFGNGNSPDQFLGTYSYGYSDYSLTASGPLFTDKIKLFLNGENYFIRDYQPQFMYGNPATFTNGASFDDPVFDNGLNGGSTEDSQVLNWNGGAVPGRMQQRFTFNGTALMDFKPLVVKLSGAFSWQQTRGNDWTYNSVSPEVVGGVTVTDLSNIYNLSRLPLNDQSNLLLSAKGTWFFSGTSFLEGNINYVDNRGKIYDPYLKDNYLGYSDSLLASNFGWTFSNYNTPPSPYNFYGFDFERPGELLTNFQKDERNNIGATLNYSTQLDKHSVKAGGSFQYWTVRRYAVVQSNAILADIRNNPDLARLPDSLISLFQNIDYSNFNNYGFDWFGNSTDAEPFAPKHPTFASAYIEDKLELSDLIVNAGLRYDYILMDSHGFIDPTNPFQQVNGYSHEVSGLVKGSKFAYVSPRLGFSFPVTDRTVFHLQYGKFVQAPSLDLAYRGIYQIATQITARNLFTNPIAYNIEPERTTSYEIGFTQQFTDFAAFDLTAYYKDIKGQPQYTELKTAPGAPKSQYAAFINQDFTTNKGVELSLRIRRVERIRAEINYTFSDNKGTNSFSNSSIGSVEINNQVPTVILPLNYAQASRGSVMLDYRFGENDGGPILQQLGINLLFTFNSGHPYTLAAGVDVTGLGQTRTNTGGLIPILDTRARRTQGPVNEASTPWNSNLDLRIDKTVNIAQLSFNFYVSVLNALNTKNVTNVYDRTGNSYDDGFLGSHTASTLTSEFKDLYQNLNLDNRQAALTLMNVDMYSTPRQIRAGVLVEF